jgi:hypothetical protein
MITYLLLVLNLIILALTIRFRVHRVEAFHERKRTGLTLPPGAMFVAPKSGGHPQIKRVA